MMEEESWICVDEGFPSDESFSDSDKVDSETEAELYSLIHFEGNLSNVDSQSSTTKNNTESDTNFLLSDKMKYVLCTKKKEYDKGTEFVCNSNNFLQNGFKEFTGRENCNETVSNREILSPDHQVPGDFVNNSNPNHLADAQTSKKRKCDDSLQNYSSPPKKAAIDSERKIHSLDVNSPGSEDIQTNICGNEDDDVIFISSDSETDLSTPSKKRISQHQNMSMPNIKIGENSKDLWFVNQEDISRARNKARRYHDKFDSTCSNCNRQGHHPRICPLPKRIKCFICGGEHTSTNCMNRICGKCLKTGHDRTLCRVSKINFCTLCQMRGHTKQNCPDLWRRYHLTTQPGEIVPDKQFKHNSFVFCCTCGRPGHFGAVCNFERKGYKNCFPTWPNVLSYDEPFSLRVQKPNTMRNGQRKKKGGFIKQKKKVLNEDQKLAQKNIKKDQNERIRKRKEEKRMIKMKQQLLNSKQEHGSKVLKEKDFPRTPKKESANNLSSPRTLNNNSKTTLFSPKAEKNTFSVNQSSFKSPRKESANSLSSPRILNYNSKTNLFSPKAKKNTFSVNQSSFKSPKNNSATNFPSTSTVDDDSVIILPTPKVKKNISVIDLTSPQKQKNNQIMHNSSDLPESVQMMMMAQERRREKNRRRRRKRLQNLRERKQNPNMST